MRTPLVLRDPEPGPVRNDIGQMDSSLIIRGTELFDALTGGGYGTAGGLPVPSERTALTISAVYACVNLIAGAISAMPLNIYRRATDGEVDLLPSDDLWWLLNEQMTPRWSAAAGWEFMILSLLLLGDAFARIIRRGDQIVGFEPIHPGRVYVLPTPDGMRLVYVIEADPLLPVPVSAERLVLDQDDVLHIPGFGFNGVRGLSPLRNHLRMVGAGALATQEYSARFFANSARPDIVLTTDKQMAPQAIDDLRNQWAEKHQSVQNAWRPAVLANGLKVQTISMPNDELQLLATRQFAIEEVARVYGVPPFMIGHTEKTTSWGSGVEQMGRGFVRWTLAQHLTKIQTEVCRKLFRTASKFARFDTTELEKADFAGLMNGLRTAIGRAGERPIMNVNEARARLNLKKAPGGDDMQPTAATSSKPDPSPEETSDAPDQTPEPPGQ